MRQAREELSSPWYLSRCRVNPKNNTTNDHTKDHPLHLITIEGGAATVRTTSEEQWLG